MRLFSSLRRISAFIFLSGFVLASASVQATTVKFVTVMGDIEVNLFDKTTPETVANFLYYLNAGSYNNGVIHRSAKITVDQVERNFVIQGGGFTYNGSMPLQAVKTKNPVVNEPLYSNVRGTIAMAKLANSENSATSGWFFNLEDNSKVLDNNNDGFTVFGQVTEASLPVLDAIAAVKTFFAGTSSSPEFPLRNYTVEDYQNNAPVDDNNLVLVTSIVITNTSPDTAASLTPIANPYYKPPVDDDNDGGGSLGIWYLGVLFMVLLAGRRFRHSF